MPRPPLSCPFFKCWTYESAYILGYWFADGGMRTRLIGGPEVYFVSNDLEHLEVIAKIIGVGTIRRVSRFREGYRLNISRRELYDDLARLGGTEQKSLNGAWPIVPESFLADFVRGYLDGDGYIGWKKNKIHPLPRVTLYGTYAFVTGVAAAIEAATGIPQPTCHDHNNTWGVTWMGIQAKCLVIWLYQNKNGIAMPRKAVVAADILAWEPKKLNLDNITTRMWDLFGAYLP